MKCVICKHGETRSGTMTATFERDGATIVLKEVPAAVCDSCGEDYLSQEITQQILEQVKQAAKSGVQVDIRRFTAA